MRVLSMPGALAAALIGSASALTPGKLGASDVLDVADVASPAVVSQLRIDAGVQGIVDSGMDADRGPTAVVGVRVHAHSL